MSSYSDDEESEQLKLPTDAKELTNTLILSSAEYKSFDHRKWLFEEGWEIEELYNELIMYTSTETFSIVGLVRVNGSPTKMYLLEVGNFKEWDTLTLYFSDKLRTVYVNQEDGDSELWPCGLRFGPPPRGPVALTFLPITAKRIIGYHNQEHMESIEVEAPRFTLGERLSKVCDVTETQVVEENFPTKHARLLLIMIDALRNGKNEKLLWDTFPSNYFTRTPQLAERDDDSTWDPSYRELRASVRAIRRLLQRIKYENLTYVFDLHDIHDKFVQESQESLAAEAEELDTFSKELLHCLATRAEVIVEEGLNEL